MSARLFAVTFAQPEQVTARPQGFAVGKVETLATNFLDGAQVQAGALDAARE